SPGADDNASGVAVLIELARMGLPARFIAFANEEMPYFETDEMGSQVWAREAARRGERIRAMLSLEMLGYYRDLPRSPHSAGTPDSLPRGSPHRRSFPA